MLATANDLLGVCKAFTSPHLSPYHSYVKDTRQVSFRKTPQGMRAKARGTVLDTVRDRDPSRSTAEKNPHVVARGAVSDSPATSGGCAKKSLAERHFFTGPAH